MKQTIPIWWLIPFALLLLTLGFLWRSFIASSPKLEIDAAAVIKPIADLESQLTDSAKTISDLNRKTNELASKLTSITRRKPPNVQSNALNNAIKRKYESFFNQQKSSFGEMRNDVSELGRRITNAQSQLTAVDGRIGEAIRDTEANLKKVEIKNDPKTTETMVVLIGLLASILTMAIAWRKDVRETREHAKEMAGSGS